jgi:hypothetical protein
MYERDYRLVSDDAPRPLWVFLDCTLEKTMSQRADCEVEKAVWHYSAELFERLYEELLISAEVRVRRTAWYNPQAYA